jgi:hypothetical protein
MISGKIKIYNSIKIGHILCIENIFVKDLLNAKNLGQFKQNKICKFIHDMKFQVFFLPFKFNLKILLLFLIHYYLKYSYILITSSKTICRIISF